MIATMKMGFIFLCLMLSSSAAYAMEVDVAAGYGGSIIAPEPAWEHALSAGFVVKIGDM